MNRFSYWLDCVFKVGKTKPWSFHRIDFTNTFPYIDWISNWGHNEEYPDGFRYKVLSLITEPQLGVEAVLVRELRDGTKTEISRFCGSAEKLVAIEDAVHEMGEKLCVDFERFDMRQCRTFEDYKTKVASLNGHIAQELPPLLQGSIAGHDGGTVFVAAYDDFKEVFTRVLG